MTGRELIIYILANGLEDEPIVKDGRIVGFLTVSEVAAMYDVGVATIGAWIFQGRLHCVTIGGAIYIPADFTLKEVENNGY